MENTSYTEEESREEFTSLLEKAHYDAAYYNQNNVSATVAMIAFDGSSDPMKAISAAISSMGGRHAPLQHARALIRQWKQNEKEAKNYIKSYLKSGQKIPGFGNSFFKDRVDPSFKEVYSLYIQRYSNGDEPLHRMGEFLNILLSEQKQRQINLFPNAAGITGAIAEYLEFEPFHEISIALTGRIPAWLDLISHSLV